MSSPDRMEMHARAIANLIQAMDRMEAEHEAQEQRFQVMEEKFQVVKARAREWKEWEKAHEEWRKQFWAHMRELTSAKSSGRSDIQADIARLDAAS